MERSDVWFLVTTGTILGFIGGMALKDLGRQTTWLVAYQTLAAWFTVDAMTASEERR